MYPTLFQIAGFRVDTYSVIWFIALSLAIIWAIKRLEIYNIDEDEARKIMSVSFLFMLLGARSVWYFENWKKVFENPSLLLDLNRGGLHEVGALLGAFISAFLLSIFNKKISFLKLCEVAAPPAMLSIAIGRWGCFLNGCCVGRRTDFFTAVHFPFDKAGVMRHPVQIYYSLTAFIIVLILVLIEKKIHKKYKLSNSHSIITPLTIISYSLMRIFVDITRVRWPLLKRITRTWHYGLLAVLVPLCLLWLVYGLLRLKNKDY